MSSLPVTRQISLVPSDYVPTRVLLLPTAQRGCHDLSGSLIDCVEALASMHNIRCWLRPLSR